MSNSGICICNEATLKKRVVTKAVTQDCAWAENCCLDKPSNLVPQRTVANPMYGTVVCVEKNCNERHGLHKKLAQQFLDWWERERQRMHLLTKSLLSNILIQVI